MRSTVASVSVLAIVGCAHGVRPPSEEPSTPSRGRTTTDSRPAAPRPDVKNEAAPSPPSAAVTAGSPGSPKPAEAGGATPEATARAIPGAISRARLQRIHRAGPQVFIQKIRVRPTFRRGRFFGWRVLAYSGPGPVRRGDIVMRVNGRQVERPDQFMRVWEQIPRREELVVEMLRAGRRVTLRYPIVD